MTAPTKMALVPVEATWQPIATCPSDGERIWVRGGRYVEPTIRESDGDWWRSMLKSGSIATPTEWAPLHTPSASPSSGRVPAADLERAAVAFLVRWRFVHEGDSIKPSDIREDDRLLVEDSLAAAFAAIGLQAEGEQG